MDYDFIEEEVKKAKTNDSKAIINIINSFKPYCLTLIKNTEIKGYDKEDLLQELNIKIIKCILKYNKDKKFVGYCTRALKNHMYYLYRNNKNNNISLTDTLDNKINSHYDTYNNFDYLKKLNKLEKNIIVLYYINGNTLKKISNLLNINYSKTIMLKNNAIIKIKNEMKHI